MMTQKKNDLSEVRTDIKLLLECIEYQKDCPSSLKQALVTLSTILTSNAGIKDEFRDSGDLQKVLDITTSTRYLEVTDAGLYCLASAVEGNAYSKKFLSTGSTFSFLHGMLSTVEESSVRRKQTAAYFLLCLVANNNFGQNLMRQSHCLHAIISLIRISLPKTIPSVSNTSDIGVEKGRSLQLWATVISAASVCVNNPRNEDNQALCSGLFPYLFSILHLHQDHRVVCPILSVVGQTVAENVHNQDRVRKCGGLKLFVDMLRALVSQRSVSSKSQSMAVQIIGTIDTVISDNDDNVMLLVQFEGIEAVMKFLRETTLSDQDTIKVIVTLANAVETVGKKKVIDSVKKQILNDNGMAYLIQQLTKTSNEELSQTIKYLLHLCVSTDQGETTPADPVTSIPAELEPFLEQMELMKMKNDSALLQKINDLDAKLKSLETESSLKDNSSCVIPSKKSVGGRQVTKESKGQHQECEYIEDKSESHFSTHCGETDETSAMLMNSLCGMSPREKVLLDQLVMEKKERCHLQRLNLLLQENMLKNKATDKNVIQRPPTCGSDVGNVGTGQDQSQMKQNQAGSTNVSAANCLPQQQEGQRSLSMRNIRNEHLLTENERMPPNTRDLPSIPRIRLTHGTNVSQNVGKFSMPACNTKQNTSDNFVCNPNIGIPPLKTPKPLDLTTHYLKETNSDVPSSSLVVQRNKRMKTGRHSDALIKENQKDMQVGTDDSSSLVVDFSKTIVGGLMDVIKNIHKIAGFGADGDASSALNVAERSPKWQQSFASKETLDIIEAPGNSGDCRKDASLIDLTTDPLVLRTTDSPKTNMSITIVNQEMALMSGGNTLSGQSVTTRSEDVTEKNHCKRKDPCTSDSNEPQPQLYFMSSNTEESVKNTKTHKIKSRNQNISTVEKVTDKQPLHVHATETSTDNSRLLAFSNGRADQESCFKTPVKITTSAMLQSQKRSGSFCRPLSAAPKSKVRITPKLGFNQSTLLNVKRTNSEACVDSGRKHTSRLPYSDKPVQYSSDNDDTADETMSQFDSHLLKAVRKSRRKDSASNKTIGKMPSKQTLNQLRCVIASPFYSRWPGFAAPQQPYSPFTVKPIGRIQSPSVSMTTSNPKKHQDLEAKKKKKMTSDVKKQSNCLADLSERKRIYARNKASSKCPACRCPSSIGGIVLNSRTFNLSLETCPHTCQNHRLLRQLERKFIHKVKQSNKRRSSQARQRGRLDKTLLEDREDDRHHRQQKVTFVYDFPNDTDQGQISSDLDSDSSSGVVTIATVEGANQNRRSRIPYTSQEVAHLLQGVARLGKFWNQILLTFKFHPSRTAVDLKDKYRRMQMQSSTKKKSQTEDTSSLCGTTSFSMCEERRLKRGVKKMGYNWKTILNTYNFAAGRTAPELREKWRSIHSRRSSKVDNNKTSAFCRDI